MKDSKSTKKSLTKKQQQILIAAIAAVVVAGGGGAYYFLTRPTDNATTSSVSSTSDAGVGNPNFNEYSEYTLQLKDGENTITEAGVYTITGNITGYLTVNVEKNVKLILDNVSITSSGQPAIFIENAKNAVIELVGSNTITASVANYDHPGAIFSKDDLLIQGDGSLSVTSDEDGIVSKDDLEIKSGNITVSAGDDAIRGNDSVKISGGDVKVTKSYEGIEGEVIEISGGNISVVSSDDGINAADKNGEGNALSINISGGTTYVNAGGDGLDSNGSIYISGGTTYVDGPTDNGNGALDYEEKMEVTGGTLIAVGSSGMAMNASSSTQASVLVGLTSSANGQLSIGSISYTPQKSYASVYITSPDLKVGETYELKAGNTTTSVEISDNITNVNISGMGMMGGGMPGGGQGGPQGQAPQGESRQMMRR